MATTTLLWLDLIFLHCISTLQAKSAKFEKSSIHGNYYQVAIIDVKSKYVWDFYLETKD